jgi:hypothetical protein
MNLNPNSKFSTRTRPSTWSPHSTSLTLPLTTLVTQNPQPSPKIIHEASPSQTTPQNPSPSGPAPSMPLPSPSAPSNLHPQPRNPTIQHLNSNVFTTPIAVRDFAEVDVARGTETQIGDSETVVVKERPETKKENKGTKILGALKRWWKGIFKGEERGWEERRRLRRER